MKVLVVIDALNFGGAENVLVTLAGRAADVGLELSVVVIAPPTEGRGQWEPRLRDAGLSPRYLGIRRVSQPDAVVRVLRAIRAERPDVVHAHLGTASTFAPVASWMAGVACVCTLHHVPGPLQGRDAARERLSVAAASRSQGLIFVSEASRRGFAARYPRRTVQWTVIPNGVDLARFREGNRDTRDPLTDFGVAAGTPVVMVVGHMRPGKGHDVAVECWPAVRDSHPDARLVLVGDGPLEGRLRARVSELGVEGQVLFAGVRNDVDVLLRRATVVALPTAIEALPTALIEAGASGVPVVATRVGGVPEVVVDGSTGWLVDEPLPELFAEALTTALKDDAGRAMMGVAAREHVERHFDADRWARRLRGAYSAAVERGTLAGLDEGGLS